LQFCEVVIELSLHESPDPAVMLSEELRGQIIKIEALKTDDNLSFQILFPAKIDEIGATAYMFSLMDSAPRRDSFRRIIDRLRRIDSPLLRRDSDSQKKIPDAVQPSLF
jgi:hypothetical protein